MFIRVETHVVMAGVLKAQIFQTIYWTKFKEINKKHQKDVSSPGGKKPFRKVFFNPGLINNVLAGRCINGSNFPDYLLKQNSKK